AFGEPVKGLPCQELLSDLALELDAVRAVLGHGLPSLESPARRSILSRPIVRPQGPTPIEGQSSTPMDTSSNSRSARMPGRLARRASLSAENEALRETAGRYPRRP